MINNTYIIHYNRVITLLSRIYYQDSPERLTLQVQILGVNDDSSRLSKARKQDAHEFF